ncbi:hypothetical protein pb186bvf_011721 [Paramecium bursaria]
MNMIRTKQSFFKRMNAYERPVNLYLEHEFAHRTYFGVGITFSIIAILCLQLYQQVIELILHNNPNASTNISYQAESDLIYLTEKNFTFTFVSKKSIINQVYISQLSQIQQNVTAKYIIKPNFNSTFVYKNIPLTLCSDSILKSLHLTNQVALCIDWTQINRIELQGSIDSNNIFTQLQLNLQLCTAGSLLNPNCTDSVTAQNIASNDILELLITSGQVDLSQEIPNSNFVKTLRYQVSTQVNQQINLVLQQQQTSSDDGYVLAENKDYLTLSISENSVQFGSAQQGIFQINIYQDALVLQTSRAYTKIQDFLANIGGLYQIFFVIGYGIVMPALNLSYKVKLLNQIFNFDLHKLKNNQVAPDQSKQIRHQRLQSIFMKAMQLEKMSRASALASMDSGNAERSKSIIIDQINSSIAAYFKDQEGKLDVSIFDYVWCCDRQFRGSKQALINYSMEKVTHNLDIIYIAKKLQEIDKLKMILLEPNQIKLFDYLPKPKISSIHQLDEMSEIYTILRPDKSDIERALEAQKAFQEIQSQQQDKISKQLISFIDEDLLKLFKINMGKSVNKKSTPKGLTVQMLEKIPSQISNGSKSDNSDSDVESFKASKNLLYISFLVPFLTFIIAFVAQGWPQVISEQSNFLS